MIRTRLLYVGMSLMLLVGIQTPALAREGPPAPSTLVIGVDHLDSANQQLDNHRWFEYTDFFSRDVTVRRGEVLDFKLAAGNFGHAIGLAGSQSVARRVYPILTLDSGDSPAIGTGKPKIEADTPGGFRSSTVVLVAEARSAPTRPARAAPMWRTRLANRRLHVYR